MANPMAELMNVLMRVDDEKLLFIIIIYRFVDGVGAEITAVWIADLGRACLHPLYIKGGVLSAWKEQGQVSELLQVARDWVRPDQILYLTQ